ncbi:transcription factor [Candidatus Bathyarchaeota archaeon]|nr:transcription factor [Candidatus Bathyarchaeota archaeon]
MFNKRDKDVAVLSYVDDATLIKVAEALGEEEAVKLIEILKNSNETTDDEIANKTGVRLNSVRKILYKLYDHSLVGLRRTRDPQTGWFIFHWKLQPDQLEGFILSQKRRVLEKLNTRLEYEKNHEFYYCNTPECKQIPFEEAIELLFKCPTCEKPLMHYDNNRIVQALTRKVEQLRKELGE